MDLQMVSEAFINIQENEGSAYVHCTLNKSLRQLAGTEERNTHYYFTVIMFVFCLVTICRDITVPCQNLNHF